jgi:hypothetical protein
VLTVVIILCYEMLWNATNSCSLRNES